ncbi:MAG TPA: aminotransferase class III-fold pyridoxal phosphate-dependent enzyme, partial [Chitinophagales bacterium]|nr:aminotransferase class III-fold pyridoxal phosphate-dependent enzyme [Chitinophagales bacterium]
PAIKNLRSIGLLMAIEFENETFCRKVVAACVKSGVITDWFLFAAHCMRIAPPLTITIDEIKNCCEILKDCIQKVVDEN